MKIEFLYTVPFFLCLTFSKLFVLLYSFHLSFTKCFLFIFLAAGQILFSYLTLFYLSEELLYFIIFLDLHSGQIFTSSFLFSTHLWGKGMKNWLGRVVPCPLSPAQGQGTRDSLYKDFFLSCLLYSPSPTITGWQQGDQLVGSSPVLSLF